MFEALVSYHRTARGSARTQTLEGLEGLVGEPEWRKVLAEDENLCEILAVEDGEKAQLLAALRFLRALLDGAVEPGEVFKRARGISLVIVGAAQESELIRSAALSVCAVVAGDCIDELVESDLPASFLAWRECSTFKLWRETISVLCQLFLLAPPNLAVHFLELGFADALTDAISTSYTPDHLLHALIALISIWRNTGHSENIEALTDNSALLSAITQTPTAAPILDILFPGD
jgi:hypothetical protein